MMVVPFLYDVASVTLLIPKLNGSKPSVVSHLLVDNDPNRAYSGVSKSGTAPQPITFDGQKTRIQRVTRGTNGRS